MMVIEEQRISKQKVCCDYVPIHIKISSEAVLYMHYYVYRQLYAWRNSKH